MNIFPSKVLIKFLSGDIIQSGLMKDGEYFMLPGLSYFSLYKITHKGTEYTLIFTSGKKSLPYSVIQELDINSGKIF